MNVVNPQSQIACRIVSLGRVEYLRAWDIQRGLHRQVADGLLPNLLLLLEHPHVYTLGRRGKPSDILASPRKLAELGVEVHHIDRGGEVTYHGPGQLVGYPIVNLRAWGGSPLRYVQKLEQALIATLAEFGIEADSSDRPTGVWVGDAKITAIGARVSRGVTMHGFALNVNPDLSYFDHIIPCGMPESSVTSMASELSDGIDTQRVIPVLARHVGRTFGWVMEWSDIEELERAARAQYG